MALNSTRNDIDSKARAKVVELLNPLLATSIDLQLQAKQAHWNVKGPNFIALHELFDDVTEAVEGGVDLIAERIVQLGGTAEGTLQDVSKASKLPAFPDKAKDWKDVVAALSDAIAKAGKGIRAGIESAGTLGDQGTADILTEVSRSLDKYLWFVESHLQG